jgi:hypothetical protein
VMELVSSALGKADVNAVNPAESSSSPRLQSTRYPSR